MKVLFTQKVREYTSHLIRILYEKEYFGFEEAAKKYVDSLIIDIETNLPSMQHKNAPKYFDKYGKEMFYANFRKNKQTTWYAFFSKYKENGETIYLVRYIANNHTVAQYL